MGVKITSLPPYSMMARVYEEMIGVDFDRWARYIEETLRHHDLNSTGDLLDLGCGPASVGLRLAARGWNLTGVDIEPAMVKEARRLAKQKGIAAEFHPGDIRTFDLKKEFDVCLCLHDTINHLMTSSDVQAAFKRVAAHLRPGGLFIFDLLTEASLLDNFVGKVFENEMEDLLFHWETEYNRADKEARVSVTFSPLEEGSDEIFLEEHLERVYQIDEIKSLLYNASLIPVGVYELFTHFPPRRRSYGINVVARREASSL